MQKNHGAVAAGHQETAKAATEILKAGGNAFDAVIGGVLAACVAEPVLASLGGGGFLAARTADGKVRHIDFFTQTPRVRPTQDMVDFYPIVADFGTAQQEFHIGLGSVATPGIIDGLHHIHQTLGRMPMSDVVTQARALANAGVRLNGFQSYLLGVVGPIYQSTDAAKDLFCKNSHTTATLLGEGDLLTFPNFAEVLGQLAKPTGKTVVHDHIMSRIDDMVGCTVRREDMENYHVEEYEPLAIDIAGGTAFLNPPPSIGGALISFMLDQVSKHSAPLDPLVVLAAMQACNRARRNSGIDLDPSDALGALREAARYPSVSKGTTHISVADAAGNLAALTISNGEGCGHVVPGTDIMLNNMLGEEDLNAAGFFKWPVNHRLSSMMSPGLLQREDGSWIAFGSGGSNRIRSALFQVIYNISVLKMTVRDAVIAPRMHLENDVLSLEPEHAIAELSDLDLGVLKRQQWERQNMFFGGVHAVVARPDGSFEGIGDPRRDGCAINV